MPLRIPWRGKKQRRRSKTTQERKKFFDLRQEMRKAKRREEFLDSLQNQNPDLYRQIMANEFQLKGLYPEGMGDGDQMGGGMTDEMQEIFQMWLQEKLLGEEDAVDKLFAQVERLEQIRATVAPRSTEGMGGMLNAITEILKGPVGSAFAQAMMAGKNPHLSAPTYPQLPTPAPASLSGYVPDTIVSKEELPMLPDWISLDDLALLMELSPGDAAMRMVRVALSCYNDGDGRPLDGIRTITSMPIPVVKLVLQGYAGHPYYGADVKQLLGKGLWVDQFLVALIQVFREYQQGDLKWTTTNGISEEGQNLPQTPSPVGL